MEDIIKLYGQMHVLLSKINPDWQVILVLLEVQIDVPKEQQVFMEVSLNPEAHKEHLVKSRQIWQLETQTEHIRPLGYRPAKQ